MLINLVANVPDISTILFVTFEMASCRSFLVGNKYDYTPTAVNSLYAVNPARSVLFICTLHLYPASIPIVYLMFFFSGKISFDVNSFEVLSCCLYACRF